MGLGGRHTGGDVDHGRHQVIDQIPGLSCGNGPTDLRGEKCADHEVDRPDVEGIADATDPVGAGVGVGSVSQPWMTVGRTKIVGKTGDGEGVGPTIHIDGEIGHHVHQLIEASVAGHDLITMTSDEEGHTMNERQDYQDREQDALYHYHTLCVRKAKADGYTGRNMVRNVSKSLYRRPNVPRYRLLE